MDSVLDQIQQKLSSIAKFEDLRLDNDAFNLTFARIFAIDLPEYALGKGMYGASRSNWTYHTASAMGQTAKVFGYTCKFETAGKRDAVFETRDDPPRPVIVAEWEWDYLDIFGPKKELEKLRDTCKACPEMDALLLVYCPMVEVPDYLYRITQFWQENFTGSAEQPMLYIHTVVFELDGTSRTLIELVTIAVAADHVWLMSSLPL